MSDGFIIIEDERYIRIRLSAITGFSRVRSDATRTRVYFGGEAVLIDETPEQFQARLAAIGVQFYSHLHEE